MHIYFKSFTDQMTDQRFCVHNPPVQCVEVKFVTIVDGFDTQRHFDQILIQIIPQEWAIRRWFISNNPRFPGSAETNSTIAHIELYDHHNHGLLAEMLNGYSFHGNKLKSGPGHLLPISRNKLRFMLTIWRITLHEHRCTCFNS